MKDDTVARTGDIVKVYWRSYGWLNGVITRIRERPTLPPIAHVTCATTIPWSNNSERLLVESEQWLVNQVKPVKNPSRIRDARARNYLIDLKSELLCVDITNSEPPLSE